MASILPLEIEEAILDILASEDKRHSALKTCSLVCQAFLPICRKHIFESIFLNEISSSSIRAFERLLRKTPEIANHIRKLDFSFYQVADSDPSIQESFKRISRLEFLRVQIGTTPRLDWSNNPMRPLFLHLLHLPTLTHFAVRNIKNFVVSDLIPCVNLKYFKLGITTVAAENTFPATLPKYSIQLNEFVAEFGTSAIIMKLCTARRPDGHPIIDFGSLSKIKVDIEDSNGGEASQELFRRCHALTNVQIFFRDPRNVRPSLADMLRPSMQTLKHIVVEFYDVDIDVGFDPLFGIPSELEDMRNKNIIETIGISVWRVNTRRGYNWDLDWGRLDEVLSALRWFSLKRVSLSISIYRFSGNDNKQDVALRKLILGQFPRLSSSNSVSFDFKVNNVHE